ncbi:MAG: hypothetical protein M3N49_06910 [Candidatus Eremiobacteraeota bacterium]|nr:hypothetical protein [Candidatus Eremiobacteraeota bacterium]
MRPGPLAHEQTATRSASVEHAAARCRAHVLSRIEQTAVAQRPFAHAFIEDVFPDDVYDAVHAHMVSLKHSDRVQDRDQDNPAFTNRRYNLFDSTDEVVQCVRAVFSDPDVKHALLRKFYLAPLSELAGAVSIHHEFEYVFTKAGRFQNIHVDIPPKFLSFVFYVPERPAPAAEEGRNGTILYDKSLAPHYGARFRKNSVCIFAPHYYSYHGFSSTIDRDALVMFYVDEAALAEWQHLRRQRDEQPPFDDVLDAIERKLRRFPLIEYGRSEQRLLEERSGCRVNAPQGRVLA